jgi:cytochrome c oxidase assembly protein subunit 15
VRARHAKKKIVQPSGASAVPYNHAYHRFAVFFAIATFLLIIAGALVTSNDAGLSVPDWPTSFGSLWKLPPMVGGVKFEHGHRVFAEFVGLLTILMAVWTHKVEQRRWMRILGWTALATVVLQGILGGITVLRFLPWTISTAHATLGQTFLCLVIVMALVTGRSWLQADHPLPEQNEKPSTPALATLAAVCVWLQLILGAAFRHSGIKLLPHIIGACIVTAILCWTVVRVLARYGHVPPLRRPAEILLALLMIQLGLGFVAYLTRIQWGHDPVQLAFSMVLSTVSHVAGGALVLATSVVLAIQVLRRISVPISHSATQAAARRVVTV